MGETVSVLPLATCLGGAHCDDRDAVNRGAFSRVLFFAYTLYYDASKRKR
jgi:hypothetical protein